MARFLNPYNFVRPLPEPQNLPPLSEDTADLHLLWRCPPPPHDRYTGLSGRITCTMRAKTPVFVSDSEIVSEQNGHKTYRFFNVNGDDVIPASSLRGSIRSVFEAVTNSTFGAFTFKDEPLFYRQSPDVALRIIPARVEADPSSSTKLGLRLLNDGCSITVGKRDPVTFYHAWIPKYPNEQILKKTPRYTVGKDGKEYDRHVHKLDRVVSIPSDCVNGSKCYAAIIESTTLKGRNRKGFPHLQADYIAKSKTAVEAWCRQQTNLTYRVVAGYVYITGLNADVKQYERFFCFDENVEKPLLVPLTDQNIDQFHRLMSDYHKRKDSIANSLSNAEREGIQPSRFIQQLEQLKEGTLVYADLKGTNHNPEVRAIYPVAISRAMYDRTVQDVIAVHHPHLLPPTNINELCLASRVFGWVGQEADKQDLTQEVAYRGRVRFSHADVITENKDDTPMTLAILGAPHPTAVEFYLDQPNERKLYNYNNDQANIRGRKIYRHHKPWEVKKNPAEQSETQKEATRQERDDQNRTIQGVYQPGSTWIFTIDFENLQPVELGALLWTLELREGDRQGYHRIGYGKPLGFGSVQIDVRELDFYDAKTRYTPEQTGLADGIEHKSVLIQRFREGMQILYGAGFSQLDSIQDLLALLSERNDTLPIHYPRLNPNRQASDNEGFRWFMANRGGQPERLKSTQTDDSLPYDVSANNRRNRR